jgi:hypothetical protein
MAGRKCDICGADLPPDLMQGLCPKCVPKQIIADDDGSGDPNPAARARQVKSDKPMALRRMPSGLYATGASIKDFETDAKARGNLQHPNGPIRPFLLPFLLAFPHPCLLSYSPSAKADSSKSKFRRNL